MYDIHVLEVHQDTLLGLQVDRDVLSFSSVTFVLTLAGNIFHSLAPLILKDDSNNDDAYCGALWLKGGIFTRTPSLG